MTNVEITGLLVEYRAAKNRAKELKAKMVECAVTDIGVNQKEATQCDIETFLDGYLFGQGVMQSYRKTGT